MYWNELKYIKMNLNLFKKWIEIYSKNELKFIQKMNWNFFKKMNWNLFKKMNWNWSKLKWIDTKLHSADLRTKNEGIIADKFLNDILEFE